MRCHLIHAPLQVIPAPRPRPERSLRAAGPLGAAAVLLALFAWRPVRRVVVQGDSMLPALVPGDRLLVVRPLPLRAGDLVAVPDPRDGRLLVKRVVAAGGGRVEVVGDNSEASTDSRHFGSVPRWSVAGRVVRRYAPADRAGRVL